MFRLHPPVVELAVTRSKDSGRSGTTMKEILHATVVSH